MLDTTIITILQAGDSLCKDDYLNSSPANMDPTSPFLCLFFCISFFLFRLTQLADGFVGSPNRYRSSKTQGFAWRIRAKWGGLDRNGRIRVGLLSAGLTLLLIIAVLIAANISRQQGQNDTMEDLVVKRLEVPKSPGDPKEYRLVLLRNGLWALLVSDPTTAQSGASLSVGTGSFGDPVTISGLAHFLEHMLFLGTEKYPDENSYSSFMSGHGGMDNAFTAGRRPTITFRSISPFSTKRWVEHLHVFFFP